MYYAHERAYSLPTSCVTKGVTMSALESGVSVRMKLSNSLVRSWLAVYVS